MAPYVRSRISATMMVLITPLAGLAAPELAAQAPNATLVVRVHATQDGRKLAGVAVQVLATSDGPVAGAETDAEGSVTLTLPAGRYTVVVSRFGFAVERRVDQDLAAGEVRTVRVGLTPTAFDLDAVVVSASRREEKALSAPATVAIVGEELIAQRAASTPVDHVRALPGVDVAQTGIQQTNIVARGFNNIFSGSLLMLVDNRPANVPSLRLNAPHWIPTPDLDLERIEVLLGPGAALYGPNAANGVLHLITSSPIDRPGTSVSLTTGERSLFHGAFRTAWAGGDAVGIKVSGQYLRANDWEYIDPVEVAARNDNPANPLLANRDFGIERWGGEIRLDYRPAEGTELIVSAGTNTAGNGIELSGIGAGQVKDWRYDYAQARIRKGSFFGQILMNETNSGDSYLLRTGGPIVDRSRFWAAQLQHTLELGERQSLIYGLDAQRTVPRTRGAITGRNEDDDIINEVGGYVHSTTAISQQVELVGALRVDYHDRTQEVNVSPRAAVVLRPADNQTLRASFNRAFQTPTTNNLFLDVLAATLPIAPGLSYDLRARGVPARGFTFGTCAGGLDDLCMRVPAAPGMTLPADATLAWDDLVALLAPDLGGLLPNPGSQVGTVLRRFSQEGAATGDPFPLDLEGPRDIAPIVSTISDTYEAGYQGILGNGLLVSADVYYTRIKDFVGPLNVETPNVFLDPLSTAAYVQQQLGPLVSQGALAQADVDALIAGLVQVPVGTVAPEQSDATDLLLTYRNFGNVDLWGIDIGATALLGGGFSLIGSFSWVSEECFDFNGDGLCKSASDISLNAPQVKGALMARFEDPTRGTFAGLRVRYNGGFPMNSAVYVGDVTEYTLVDLNAGLRLPRLRGTRLGIDVSNIFDRRHREFVGAPQIGRLLLLKLRVDTN